MAIGTYISIITLFFKFYFIFKLYNIVLVNVNGLNAPTKRHRLAGVIQTQDPYICCLQETHFRPKGTCRLKVRRWKIYSMQIGSKRKLE